jgi:hypothetical protein
MYCITIYLPILSICIETTIFNHSVETAPAANPQALSGWPFRVPRTVKRMDFQGKEAPIRRSCLELDCINLPTVYMRRTAFIQGYVEVCRLSGLHTKCGYCVAPIMSST